MPPKATEEPPEVVTRRLNTSDVKGAFDFIVTRGAYPRRTALDADFEWIVNAKDYLLSFVDGNTYFEQARALKPVKAVTRSIRSTFDHDGDGKVSAADYRRSYQSSMDWMVSKQPTLDYWLPFLGQCAFGMICGWIVGRAARKLYTSKVMILVLGGGTYLGAQYLAEQRVIDYDVLRFGIERQVRQTLDVNSDGELNRKDVEDLVAQRMKVVVDKLGPQVFAPGMLGVATFGVGLLRGVRFF